MKYSTLFFLPALIVSFVAGSLPAADPAKTVAAGHSYHGDVFNEGPRQKAYLMGGTGNVHFKVTTKKPLVQKLINQGIGQLHGFWNLEAERSFRQAAAIDPDCAIAYWGVAIANFRNQKRAYGFTAEAVKRKAKASPREVKYIDALAAYFKVDPKKKEEAKKKAEEAKKKAKKPAKKDPKKEQAKNKKAAEKKKQDEKKKAARKKAFVKSFEKIAYEFPDDLEAKAFLARYLYLMRSKETPITSYLAVSALIEQVLAVEPKHPVHHYRIHLWDHEKPERALSSAALCGQSAPSIAHMWHMPGHIYSRLKRYEDACWQQEASARADHAHMMRDRVMPDQIHNFAHNNEWLIRNLMYVGRVDDGIDLARNMIQLPRHPKYNKLSGRGSASFGRRRLIEVLTRYERWEDLARDFTNGTVEPTGKEDGKIKHLRMLGEAHVLSGNQKAAEKQTAELDSRRKKLVAERDKKVSEAEKKAREAKKGDKQIKKAKDDAAKGLKPRIDRLDKALQAIRGRIAIVAGKHKEGFDLLKKAGGVEKLQLARVRFLAGEKDPAIKTVRDEANRNKQDVRPLAALVDLLWLADKKDEAVKELEKLRKLSGSIQLNSPLFARLAPVAKHAKLPEDWRLAKKPASDVGKRPPLDSLGPFRWRPMPAAMFALKDETGKTRSLADYRGKPVVVIFYLGSGCLHCAEQLAAFGPKTKNFTDAGISLLAISTDDAKGLKESIKNYDKGGFPFPLVENAALDVFKAYRAYDDFENQTLHGTFLIDGDGLVRWQDISYQPFMEPDFLLKEAQRLLRQKVPPVDQTAAKK